MKAKPQPPTTEVQPEVQPIQIPTLPGYELKPTPAYVSRILSGEALLLGLDVGYGVTKALAWGFSPVLFRTIYGYERDLGYDRERILATYPGEWITTDEGTWFVGDLATRQLNQSEQLSLRGRDDANAIRRLMMLAAIGKMFPDVYRTEPIVVRIATGLPVDHMGGASLLKQSLVGRWLVDTDQCKFPVEIEYVSVMPQPNGTINAYSLRPDGEENPFYTYSKIGVIDNGRFSVDISTEEDGLFINPESGTIETGMHTAFDRIATQYNEEFGEIPSDRVVENILLKEGKFKAYGEPQDWSNEVSTVLKPMRDATIGLARSKLRRGATHEIILNVGGPAPLVKDIIRKEYKQAVMPAQSQITNALGYLHYAAFAVAEDS